MATIPVPAVVVTTSDPRLFPSEEQLERERAEAREKQLPPTRPVLYTTVSDDPALNKGCKGKCDFLGCECLYFAGKGGDCARCNHANLYHRVKIRRIDLEAKAAADALKNMKYRRHIPTLQEIEEMKMQEESKPPEPVNTYPCDVDDCECKKMQQPAGWDSTLGVPKLCRSCKHAEMYHLKRKKDDKKRRGATTKGKSGKGSAVASSRGTGRAGSASAKKASGKKKKK